MTSPASRRLHWIALAVLAAGCSTTVPNAEERLAGQPYGYGAPTASPPAGALAGGAVSGGSQSGLSGPSGAATGAVGAGTAGGSAPTAGQVSGGGPAVTRSGTGGDATAIGITDTTITVGFTNDANAQQENQAIGGNTATDNGNESAYIKAVVSDINKHGGIAGRKVVPSVYTYDDTSTETTSAQEQQACAYWVSHKVYAVLVAHENDPLRTCLGQHGIPGIGENDTDGDMSTFGSQFPLWANPSTADLDRLAALMVDGLNAQGYFAPGPGGIKPKIGLFRIDDPHMQHAADAVLKPLLARLGLQLTAEFKETYPASTADYSQAIATDESAAFRFQAKGVDHVMFLTFNQAPAAFFMLAAENQHYYPKYGLNSNTGAQVLISTGVPKDQMSGANLVGWLPQLDVPLNDAPPPTSMRVHCMKVMKDAGLATTSENSLTTEMEYCESPWFLRALLGTAHTAITTSSFSTGIARVGDSFVPADTFATHVSLSVRDGASEWYAGGWDKACGCFAYRGGPHPWPRV